MLGIQLRARQNTSEGNDDETVISQMGDQVCEWRSHPDLRHTSTESERSTERELLILSLGWASRRVTKKSLGLFRMERLRRVRYQREHKAVVPVTGRLLCEGIHQPVMGQSIEMLPDAHIDPFSKHLDNVGFVDGQITAGRQDIEVWCRTMEHDSVVSHSQIVEPRPRDDLASGYSASMPVLFESNGGDAIRAFGHKADEADEEER